MDSCANEAGDLNCPSCGARGRKVGAITLSALVSGRSFEGLGWRFCRSPACGVAYYYDGVGVVEVPEVQVAITQKSSAADRPVCYCFGFSAQEIEQDRTGAIPTEIKLRCKRGEDRCAETNPQGSCCLGNVLSIARGSETSA